MKEVNETENRICLALMREFTIDGEQEIPDIVLIRSMSIFLGKMVKVKMEQFNVEGRYDLMSDLVKSVVGEIVNISGGECKLHPNMLHKKMH